MPASTLSVRPSKRRAPTVAAAPRDGEKFDAGAGLWISPRPGHTQAVAHLPTVRSGVAAARRLTVAAQLEQLDQMPVASVLAALRRLQWLDGSRLHGCFRWYLEEERPVDTNAAFFIGLNLVALALRYRERLEPESTRLLDAMLADLRHWFAREVESETLYYPNKQLGDLVCAWLLHEQADDEADEPLARALEHAVDYWLESGWGWGEHMSDGYALVLLDELSALLLLSRRLPPAVRAKVLRLFTGLLDLEDAFEGGPRVPAIRSYQFLRRVNRPNYRDLVTPWTDGQARCDGAPHIALGHLFYELGWHRLAPSRSPRPVLLETRCHGGALARSWFGPRARLGSLSRFPLMAGAERATWGLSWQSMPLAFACGESGWGFLRWHTREGGLDRHHPARDQSRAYLHNALTDAVSPPLVGRTDSLQHAADVLVLRRMPALSRQWEALEDELVLLGPEFSLIREESGPSASRLLLRAGDDLVTVLFFPLCSGARTTWEESSDESTWKAAWPLHPKCEGGVAALWMICWGREVALPSSPTPWRSPTPAPREDSELPWVLRWPRADGPVLVRIDPRDEQPLRILEPAS
jgi:hypothetical protein